jgi:hypothetical protein
MHIVKYVEANLFKIWGFHLFFYISFIIIKYVTQLLDCTMKIPFLIPGLG